MSTDDGTVNLAFQERICCCCGARKTTVRNLLTLNVRGPTPGAGWGCVVCDLPLDGAIAVICDECTAGDPIPAVQFVLQGSSLEHSALIPCTQLDLTQPFDHDRARHQDEPDRLILQPSPPERQPEPFLWFDESAEEGDPRCLCSVCNLVIGVPFEEWAAAHDEWDEPEIAIRLWNEHEQEARFHIACFEQLQDAGVLTLRTPAHQSCRICGCTDDAACLPHGCSWVAPDLCSACAPTTPEGGNDESL